MSVDELMTVGIARAITATILDLIDSSSVCQCCDNDAEHQRLLLRVLHRFDPVLWPPAAAISVGIRTSKKNVFDGLRKASTPARRSWPSTSSSAT